MYKSAVICVLLYSFVFTSAQPSRSCPMTGCLSATDPTAPNCVANAANVKKCVEDGLKSPDICECDESLVKTYYMYAGGAAAACQSPICKSPEVVQCTQMAASAFMGGEFAEKAVQCMEKNRNKLGKCVRGIYSSAINLSDKDMEDIIDINIAFYKLLSKGCSMAEATQGCMNTGGYGSDACRTVDVVVNMQKCMVREVDKQGAVCDGASELLEAGIKYMKRHLLEPACEKQKEVDKILAGCGDRSARNAYSFKHPLKRELWSLFL